MLLLRQLLLLLLDVLRLRDRRREARHLRVLGAARVVRQSRARVVDRAHAVTVTVTVTAVLLVIVIAFTFAVLVAVAVCVCALRGQWGPCVP